MDQENNPLSTNPLLDATHPIVISNKGKKKRKYSRGLKELQQNGRSLAKVSDDLARSLSKGIKTYRKASDKSAGKKRDGAMRDFGVNLAKGLSKSLRVSSSVPEDLAQALMGQGSARRRMKRQMRLAARLNRRLLNLR
jgi:uncharacterized protein YukE